MRDALCSGCTSVRSAQAPPTSPRRRDPLRRPPRPAPRPAQGLQLGPEGSPSVPEVPRIPVSPVCIPEYTESPAAPEATSSLRTVAASGSGSLPSPPAGLALPVAVRHCCTVGQANGLRGPAQSAQGRVWPLGHLRPECPEFQGACPGVWRSGWGV